MDMNKKKLVNELAANFDLPKNQLEQVVTKCFDILQETLVKGGSAQIVGFGTFKTIERGARKGRNPNTGDVMHLPATRTPKFYPGKRLTESVKGQING